MSTYQEYAKWGWPCFPIAGSAYAKNKDDYKTWKTPLVNWAEYQNRLPTPEEISSWEKKWPLAWLGVTTGPFSNLFVIDIDGEAGINSLRDLAIQMPITKIAKTQRGHHYFFKWNPKLSNYITTKSGVRPGIDVRGDGGLIIIPSFHSKRSWVVEEPCAELPEAWYLVLTKSEALPENWQAKAIAEISEGNRHDTFVRLISSCFNAKWPVESIFAVLRPLAKECKLDESLEVLILDSQRRYFKETIINSSDVMSLRLEEMKNHTRAWIAKIHPMNSMAMKLHASTAHKMMELQDQYDKEAVHWVENETMRWSISNAFSTCQKILELSNEIR